MNSYLERAEVRDYNGFEMRVFPLNGREVNVVLPKEAKDNRWIWRAEFIGAFDSADIEMLHRGYTLVYYDMQHLYGSPKAMELMDIFYNFCVSELGLFEKTILFGFSRGGLYSANFALKYPERVAALYLDAPVLDIRSWPGGLGVGVGAARNYEECLDVYGLNRSNILTYRETPADRVGELAAAKIPVCLVVGLVDVDVPYNENAEVLAKVYENSDVPFIYIKKENCAHHPHSLEDPTEICDFLIKF